MKQVAILVPGMMGSELRLGDEIIWPGIPSELIFRYKKMDKLLLENLRVTDIVRRFSFATQYASLINDLRTCGFDENGAPQPTLYVLPYDWRKKIELAAMQLADLVDKVQSDHADPLITLIGHSMGGLVSRFYLESGCFQARPGYACVFTLFTFGTPHRGAPLVLRAVLGLEPRLFLNEKQVQELSNDERYPSLYEMLPPSDEPFAWNTVAGMKYENVNIYAPEVRHALGLSEKNISAAQEFQSRLDLNKRPKGVRYFFFAGSRQVTAASVLINEETGEVARDEEEDGGDGTVPTSSAQVSGIQTQLVGGEHGTLYKNRRLLQVLAIILGKPGLFPAAATHGELSIRDRVTRPDAKVHIALSFADGTVSVDGHLQFMRVDANNQGVVRTAVPVGVPVAVKYSGAATDKLGLVLNAPKYAGLYRLVFKDREGKTIEDDIFVQQQ
jgi:hypothetical protein